MIATGQSTEQIARCLELLETATEPMVAADIATRISLIGSRESQRRKVRALIRHLRNQCRSKIVATLTGGYFLTRDDELWSDYLAGRQIDAKRILGTAYKQRKKMITDRTGQGHLFGPEVTTGLG